MKWLFSKYKTIYGDLYDECECYYLNKDVKHPSLFPGIYIGACVLIFAFVLISIGATYFLYFESLNILGLIVIPLVWIIFLIAGPFICAFSVFYIGSLGVVIFDFLFSMIPSEKFKKIYPYISFFATIIICIVTITISISIAI